MQNKLQYLKELLDNNKLSLAYALCDKYPDLKQTSLYAKMEEAYKDVFAKAQKYINTKHLDKAKEILKPYKSVLCKQDGINLLLMHNDELIGFLKAIEKKDYKQVFNIAKTNKKLTKLKAFEDFLASIDMLKSEFENRLFYMDIEGAKTILDELELVPNMQQYLKIALRKILHVEKLQQFYLQDKFVLCYEFLDMHKELLSCELGMFLDKHWNKILSTCKELSDVGDIDGVMNSFGELVNIKTRQKVVKKLIKIATLKNIDIQISKNSYEKAKKYIYQYIDNFGYDEDIYESIDRFENLSSTKLAITIHPQQLS